MTTPTNPSRLVSGELRRCQCGAQSPPSDRECDLDAWEDNHTQTECPQVQRRVWDDQLEQDRYPSLPFIERIPTVFEPYPLEVSNRLAMYPGRCCVCEQTYPKGAGIAAHESGWQCLACAKGKK